jgi:predicted RecA/RadA family phage recombinase
MNKNLLAGLAVCVSVTGLYGCDVKKTKEGSVTLPKYEVEKTQSGQVTVPKYEVTTPDVQVSKSEQTVVVPKVTTEEKTVEVPKVTVTPADKTAEKK